MKKSFIVFLFVSTLSFLLSCSPNSEQVDVKSESAKSYTHSVEELGLLDEVNLYRVAQGLKPLAIIEHISFKSAEHNSYMLANHKVTHDGFEERKINLEEVLGAYRVGENVAFAYSTAKSTVQAWTASAGHKANLEGDYTHFGAAITIDEEGKKYYTTMFIKK